MVRFNVWRSVVVGLFFLSQAGWAQPSSERALREHVHILTSDSLTGRRVGTEGEQRAAAYISHCFGLYGLEFLYPNGIQDFSVVSAQGDTLSSQNIIGLVVGSDPVLREEYIVVGAHYDHLGVHKITIDGKETEVIYRGADDNASGMAILLEMARAAAQQPYLFKRSLVFVAFGAEEMGMLGSWYFVNRAFTPINYVVLMLNLDMLGRSGTRNPFTAYTVAPSEGVANALHLVEDLPTMARPGVLGSDYFPSDHQHFFQYGIPTVLFTGGIHSDYHSPRDNPNLLDYHEMERRMAYIYAFLQQIANDESWDGEKSAAPSPEKVYPLSGVDKLPTFMKRDEAHFLKQWVNKYLKYPKSAVAQGIQGRVLVQFIIEADGSVTNVEVIESVDPLLDDEAIRVITASPKWSPGSKSGKNVRTRCVVPVYFVLKRR